MSTACWKWHNLDCQGIIEKEGNLSKELKKENEINDIEKLLEKIENDDDVQNVYHNMKSHMYTKAFKHLKKDPKINNILEKYHDKISLDSYRSKNYALSLSNFIPISKLALRQL